MSHHEAAVERFVARASSDPGCLGVIITGSVARGTARKDSDVDLYLLVTEERWQQAFVTRRLMYTDTEDIGYAGGYYDVKLATLSYLDDAAERGDDPVRDSFANSRIVFSRVDDLAERIDRICAAPDVDWDGRVASFLAQTRLHGGYFLQQAVDSGDLMLLRYASLHLATSACRALLAVNRVFYCGPKYLSRQLSEIEHKPEGFDSLVGAVLEHPSKANADAVLSSLENFTGGLLEKDATLSTFVLDNELAWRYRSKTPEYS